MRIIRTIRFPPKPAVAVKITDSVTGLSNRNRQAFIKVQSETFRASFCNSYVHTKKAPSKRF